MTKNWLALSVIVVLLVSLAARLWALDQVPPSLFGDELDAAYHAYSFLMTGKDYLGNFFPIHLQSLADSKPPLLPYTMIPSVAVFGISPIGVRLPIVMFSVLSLLLTYLVSRELTGNKQIALAALLLMSITPWHWHFSRIGLEVMEMFTLFLAAVYFFWRGLKDNRWWILSAVFFGLTVWVYHSAKIFLPLSLLMLLCVGKEQLEKINRWIIAAGIIVVVIAAPVYLDTIWGSGGNRFGSTSIFNQPVMEGELGSSRSMDQTGRGLSWTGRIFHNQYLWWESAIFNNFASSFSPQFLFFQGDPNLRHQIPGFGVFLPVQALLLLLGFYFFVVKPLPVKSKLFIGLWLILAPLPAVLTVGGGTHAIRLMMMLFPLVFIMALGIYYPLFHWKAWNRKVFVALGGILLVFNFLSYQHTYWVHYPKESGRWWTAGFGEMVKAAVAESARYTHVFISGADEPPILYFLSWSQFPPQKWQQRPMVKTTTVLGEANKLDNFYFTPTGKGFDVYTLASVLPADTLYVATRKEINLDLSLEPERIPSNLQLIKTITYPSGDPVFYLFTKKQ